MLITITERELRVRMSEEIEKIIFNLEGCCGMFDYMLTPIENNLLVSYIKELQQKSQQLKTDLQEANDNATWWNNRFNAVSKENKLYKSVLDKIRECIEKDYSFVKKGDIPLMSRAEQLAGNLFKILDKVDNGTSNE